MKIQLNDLLLECSNYVKDSDVSKPTGNKLTKITFNTSIMGFSTKKKLEDILSQNVIQVKTDDDNLEIKAEKGNISYSFYQTIQDESTRYNCSIELIELDKDLPEEWNYLAQIGHTAIMNWIRTRAISGLLIDKGLFTEKEYLDKINELVESDYENLKKLILFGIQEPEKEK